ncbi:hypothetical protein CERSUDRAFT_110569 [Gelatoporia subvermispora B]|uniref:Uncharacterized protein n=1 Tax=Ceriporiopsis subvermispora (strain B) TaxID=914234 RepID=M2RC48_CERS8|nr:hypothetical protein CERSUDRAFT_110569 [Gelatoporia subvermispora B]
MRAGYFFASLLLPFLAAAQSSSQSPQSSQSAQQSQSGSQAPSGSGSGSGSSQASQTPSVILSTSFSTGVVLETSGGQRVEATVTSPVVFTITPAPAPTAGNGTSGSSNSASSSSSLPPASTAPANIDGGGNGPNGAPSPGASAPHGIFGPNDSYTAGALSLHVNAFFATIAGVAIGSTLVFA